MRHASCCLRAFNPCSLPTGGGTAIREGFLLHISASPPGGGEKAAAAGVGEVAPLAGLHDEDCRDAEAQLALLCRLLPGFELPPSLTLLEVRPSCSAAPLNRRKSELNHQPLA